MGLFDYVTVHDPRFVCSNGHDLSAEEFQSKDFGCEMGHVLIENGRVSSHAGPLGAPEADSSKVEIYCTCRQCPAFVQFGTGNLIGCGVTFEIELESDAIKAIVRTSPATDDWLRDEPLAGYMQRCEGPMTYQDAEQLHVHYRARRAEHADEFYRWAAARSAAIQAGKAWPLSLHVGEYPKDDAGVPTPSPKWLWSGQEETWSNGSACDSREEAIAEALGTGDLVHGDRFWTGVTDQVTSEELADGHGILWEETILERIDGYLYDELGGDIDHEIKPTAEQCAELDAQVATVIKNWLDRHTLTPKCWRIAKTKCHTAKNCACTKEEEAAESEFHQRDPACEVCGGSGLVEDVDVPS